MATLTVRKLSFGTYAGGKYPALDVATLDTPIVTGDQFLNDGRTFLWARCTDGSAKTVTVAAQRASDEGITTNVVFDVPATTGSRLVGPFDASRFNDVNGYTQITYSAITGLTIAAISVAERGRG